MLLLHAILTISVYTVTRVCTHVCTQMYTRTHVTPGRDRHAGPLIRMIIEITRDMLPFLLVMAVLILGFSGAFYIIFTPPPDEGPESLPPQFANFQSTLLSAFVLMLGEVDVEPFTATRKSTVAVLLLCLFEVLGMIVLLNLLIAIMGDTFARVKEMESLHFWKGRCALTAFLLHFACHMLPVTSKIVLCAMLLQS